MSSKSDEMRAPDSGSDHQLRWVSPEARLNTEFDRSAWEADELARFLARQPEGRSEYLTGSRRPVKRVYVPSDVADTPWEDIGLPGRYPFTRGPYPTMYRSRNWTMRQIAGYGTGEDTNGRFKYLIAQGQTGLSVDFDMPTLMGYDSDDEMSAGEVGREGVAIDVLDDMEDLFRDIDLEQISVSMTINPTAWILLAMYVSVAEGRGNDLKKLSGTIQNDILKEYIAQKEWTYPIRPSMRIVRDTIVYCAQNMARYNPINISGYHISEAGASPLQELAFTMANGRAYVQEVVASGLAVDEFAPRLAFYFVSQADFFEEIAKFRAARRIWAKIMKQEFHATKPESMRLRFHCQTAAASLTKPQPYVNVVRTAFQALAAVLGGAQSLHTNGLDEAFTIPSESAMKLALRTQQVIADETNVTSVIDPLGGSWYVEALTNDLESATFQYLEKIDSLGGTVAAIEKGFFQSEVADFAYDTAMRKASGDKRVIGVNRYVDAPGLESPVDIHKVDPATEQRQVDRLRQIKSKRNGADVARLLERLQAAAADEQVNLMPIAIECVKGRCTMGEMVRALGSLWGSYTERPMF